MGASCVLLSVASLTGRTVCDIFSLVNESSCTKKKSYFLLGDLVKLAFWTILLFKKFLWWEVLLSEREKIFEI